MIAANKVVLKNILNYTLYDELNIEDRLFVFWDTFDKAADILYNKLLQFQGENCLQFDGIYAIPRGGLCLGVKLSYMMKLPLLPEKKITKNTLIVDDCTKTGKTLSYYKDNITLVMFHNSKAGIKPSLYFQETTKQINFCWESKEERN